MLTVPSANATSLYKPVGRGGSGGSDEPPARKRSLGPPVHAVSGRGNVAGPWDAKSREETSSSVEPETLPAARAMMGLALQLVWLAPESGFNPRTQPPSLHERQRIRLRGNR